MKPCGVFAHTLNNRVSSSLLPCQSWSSADHWPDPEPCTEGIVGTAAALRVTTSERGRIRGTKGNGGGGGDVKPSGFWDGELW